MTGRVRRSPLLVIVFDGDTPVLVHADTLERFRADPALVELLARLRDWTAAERLAIDRATLDALCDAGVVEREVRGDRSRDVWEPLELAVHRRTAHVGEPRHAAAGGLKPRGGAHAIDLPPPATLTMQLGDVLAARRTLRTYAARALRLDELSQLLHHAARMLDPPGPLRPFASAGARSELELYVVANDIADLEPGAWRYDPGDHRVSRVRARDEHQERLNEWVDAATGHQLSRPPPAIVFVIAVVARMTSKYGHLALSLVYKNAGCLLQNLYLVAAASGLAPCAIGGGEEPANSRWLGLDPLAESQVACFLVGPAREGGAT